MACVCVLVCVLVVYFLTCDGHFPFWFVARPAQVCCWQQVAGWSLLHVSRHYSSTANVSPFSSQPNRPTIHCVLKLCDLSRIRFKPGPLSGDLLGKFLKNSMQIGAVRHSISVAAQFGSLNSKKQRQCCQYTSKTVVLVTKIN